MIIILWWVSFFFCSECPPRAYPANQSPGRPARLKNAIFLCSPEYTTIYTFFPLRAWSSLEFLFLCTLYTDLCRKCYMYSDAAKITSRLICSCACCILVYNDGSPTNLAALLTSRHVSSNRVIVRTIVPSITSVRSVMRLNDIPLAHS